LFYHKYKTDNIFTILVEKSRRSKEQISNSVLKSLAYRSSLIIPHIQIWHYVTTFCSRTKNEAEGKAVWHYFERPSTEAISIISKEDFQRSFLKLSNLQLLLYKVSFNESFNEIFGKLRIYYRHIYASIYLTYYYCNDDDLVLYCVFFPA